MPRPDPLLRHRSADGRYPRASGSAHARRDRSPPPPAHHRPPRPRSCIDDDHHDHHHRPRPAPTHHHDHHAAPHPPPHRRRAPPRPRTATTTLPARRHRRCAPPTTTTTTTTLPATHHHDHHDHAATGARPRPPRRCRRVRTTTTSRSPAPTAAAPRPAAAAPLGVPVPKEIGDILARSACSSRATATTSHPTRAGIGGLPVHRLHLEQLRRFPARIPGTDVDPGRAGARRRRGDPRHLERRRLDGAGHLVLPQGRTGPGADGRGTAPPVRQPADRSRVPATLARRAGVHHRQSHALPPGSPPARAALHLRPPARGRHQPR